MTNDQKSDQSTRSHPVRWAEADRDPHAWRVPAARFTLLAEHSVPLSPGVLALLNEAAKDGGAHGSASPGSSGTSGSE